MAFTERAEGESAAASIASTMRDVRDVYRLLLRTLHYVAHGKRERGAVVQQMYAVGNRSMFFMAVTMAFIGAIIVYQSGLQAERLVPDYTIIGPTFLKLLVSELAPSVGALPLATRVGAGIAAEIGSMVVTEQVDAMRMSAADPVDYLVVPRFLACVSMGTVVLCLGGFVAYLAGMLVAYLSFGVNPLTFSNLMWVGPGDVLIGFVKSICYCGAIAIVSAQRGLATFGGSEGVGHATTEAVVGSCFAVITLNLVISTFGYLLS